jgi:hypothetical protein
MERAGVEARIELDMGSELMQAVDAVADMARRIQLNGSEVTYAGEKLCFCALQDRGSAGVVRRRARGGGRGGPARLPPRRMQSGRGRAMTVGGICPADIRARAA